MNALSQYRLAVGFVLLTFVATALTFGQLPDSIPTHWDLHGQPNHYMPKWPAAWLLPLTAAATVACLIRLLDAKRTTKYIIISVAALMCYFCAVFLFTAMHPAESPIAYYLAGVGAFLMAVGNILGKLTWSYFVGLRTHWTVDDPHVWERTHRASAPVYVLGGAAILLTSLTHTSPLVPIAFLFATCLYPFLHSYIVWRRG
jgi:uncharacterized membrane protein